MTTGQRIRASRHAKGLTQRQLAEQAGMHLNTIIHYENDQTDLTLLKAACLADVLDVSLDYLARRTNEPQRRIGCVLDVSLDYLARRTNEPPRKIGGVGRDRSI